MIVIKKAGKEFRVPNNDFLVMQDTSDGMYFKFKDSTELRFTFPVTAKIKAIAQMLTRATAANITIDFDSKDLISFS